jgi:hypothetical protein
MRRAMGRAGGTSGGDVVEDRVVVDLCQRFYVYIHQGILGRL